MPVGPLFLTRRKFLLTAAAVLLTPRRARASGTHPTPRRGVTAARVLTRAKLHDKEVASVFDMVRRMPQIADGIRCTCGCADLEGFRSLLSCFEAGGMAQHCDVCQGTAKLAYRLFRQGRSLAQIRTAVDKEFPQ